MIIDFVDRHRTVAGVESICRVLQVAPSTYYRYKAERRDPDIRSARNKWDDHVRSEIKRVWHENFEVYGARKVWRELVREGLPVARCTVERLMREMGLQGAVRGKTTRTTVSANTDPKPLDLVNREFHANRPNQLWVADFTYVATQDRIRLRCLHH